MNRSFYPTTELYERLRRNHRPEHRFAGESPEDWQRWRDGLLAALRGVLGDLPEPGPPPGYDVVETVEAERHVRTKIVYETRPDTPVSAWICVPRDLDGPAPGVLCLHGHSKHGVLSVIDEEHAEGSLPFATAIADAGLVTLAPEHSGFGERDSGGGCELLYARLNFLGLDVNGFRTFDVIRANDILAALPEVDESRIGNAGLSLGCWLAELHAAFDDRVRASIQSGRLSTFEQTIWHGRCICQHSHGIGALCEIPDIAGLMAPRPLAVEWGRQDTPRPVQPAFGMAQQIWRAAGAASEITLFEFDGGHRFDGTHSIPWLIEKLSTGATP